MFDLVTLQTTPQRRLNIAVFDFCLAPTSSKFFNGLVHGDHHHFSCESDERTGTHSKREM